MSYQVLRVEKKKSTAVGHMQSHNLREFNSPKKNVDSSRSRLNYTLWGCENFKETIQKRVDFVQAQQTRKIRKDCPTSLEYVISASKDFFYGQDNREYFEFAMAYIRKRHGDQNIVSAVVHLDEETPHMHVVVVPVRETEKGFKLDPKSFMTPKELTKLQTDFHKQVGKKFGLDRGEFDSEATHQTTEEHNKQLQKENRKLEEQNKKLEEQIKEKKELAAELDKLNGEVFKAPQIQYELATVKEKISLNWDGYGKRVADDVIKQINPTFKIAQAKIRELEDLKKENEKLKEKQRNHDSELLKKDEKISELQKGVSGYANMIFYVFKKLNIDIGRSIAIDKDQNVLNEYSEPLKNVFESWFNKIKNHLPQREEKKKEKTVELGHSL